MKIDIQDESAPPRGPIKARVDFTSRGTKLRLMSLFAALLLVLIAMKEAKKPETWAWLGFGRSENVPMSSESQPLSGSQGGQSGEAQDSLAAVSPVETEGSTIDRFWISSYEKLSLPEKKRFSQFLRRGLKQEVDLDEISPESEQLTRKLERFADDSKTRLLNEISLLDPQSEHKSALSQQLIAFQKHWTRFKVTALAVVQGKQLDGEQREVFKNVRSIVDQAIYGMVRDRTPVVRAQDGPAWLRTWERIRLGVADRQKADVVSPITHIQLLSQPGSYRGEWVELCGTLRGVSKVEVAQNELGLNHYYVLWIKPAETNVGPYCVYCLELPSSLSQVGKQFSSLTEPVCVHGIFFKLRSYETTEREMAVCPFVLAQTCEIVPIKPVEVQAQWQPPSWLLIGFLVVMPLVAVSIAVGVYQMTKTHSHAPSSKREEKLAKNLEQLKKNPEIKSDIQRVRELAEKDRIDTASAEVIESEDNSQRGHHV